MNFRVHLVWILALFSAHCVLAEENEDPRQSQHIYPDTYFRPDDSSSNIYRLDPSGKYQAEDVRGLEEPHGSIIGPIAPPGYSLTRNLRFGMNAYSENTTGPLGESTSASLILRYPRGENKWTPYGFTGSGRQTVLSKEWFTQFGTGAEYPFNPTVGLFMDTRWVMPSETEHYGIARLGLRFNF